jgi:hypothetical protein
VLRVPLTSQQSVATVVVGSTVEFLLIIVILTASVLRSRETAPAAFPISLFLLQGGGFWYSVEHDCPGAGALGAYTFGQSSGKYVTCRVFRA